MSPDVATLVPVRIGISSCLLGQKVRRLPTRRSHTNVLQHLAGYVSTQLDRDEREELTEMIDRYRRGLLPLY
jgi:uncharacterized protein YbgA (DUF1722 family)